MDQLLSIWYPIRNVLEIPFNLLLNVIGLQPAGWWYLVYDVVAVAAVAVGVRWFIAKGLDFFKKDSLSDEADIDALIKVHGDLETALQDSSTLKATTALLKKNKRWDRLALAYASLNSHKEAAKYFKKAGDLKMAADQLSKAGLTVKSAQMLMKAGEFDMAGRFFMKADKHGAAAKAFMKAGNSASAGAAYGKAGKYKEAVGLFREYFQAPRDDGAAQAQAAAACYQLLSDEKARGKISEEDTKALLPPIAQAFEQEKRYDLSADLFRRAGELARAAEVYVLAGKLQEAGACYKEAGRPKDAARIGGRFYEKNGRWKEAGMAYAGADEFLKAGECFAKAKEPVRAAEFLEKAEAYSRAGLMYAQGQRYENAVQMLQRVAEGDKEFDISRALLGRCFYELHDYAHCAATLENHLLGKRIDKANMDYFYMMALAKEQLGLLEESKDILYKIGAVDKKFRDVDQKISSIDSRISLMGSQVGAPPITAGNQGSGDAAVMTMVQDTLGQRYTIEAELGRGGMGVVYRAKDKQLDRQVALKFLGTLVDNNEEYRLRFVREAKTAAKINHPNIVAIYDISASQGKAYIAMEFIEGPSLHQLIKKKGKLGVREALNYMTQACGALYAIHESGIVHRDIKPDNLVIAKGGLVKVMDFGLAKAEDNRMTKANVVMGTPCYMAPEQAMGKDVDAKADMYAMGLVLYEMLTGKVLFLDGDVIARQIKEVPPKLSELVEGIPPELDALASKCVEKKPEDRFENCKVLAEEIRKIPVN